MSALAVARPGMLTTVQDLGRRGYQGLGVPVAGPMDWYSHRLANRLVGNQPSAAALELTLTGPELVAEGDVMCALAGAAFDATVNGTPVRLHEPFIMAPGARLNVGASARGARATLAVRGGFDVPVTLGSRSTHLVSRMGPFEGRALHAGDRLPIGTASSRLRFAAPMPLDLPDGGAIVRIVSAAHRDRFGDDAWRTLTTTRYVVSARSNRMGYRLEGAQLRHLRGADILSEATPVGALQVPGSGEPILLMADRQTTGGYTTIANVITADLPIAGQLAPGDWIAFSACTHEEALAALRHRVSALGEPL